MQISPVSTVAKAHRYLWCKVGSRCARACMPPVHSCRCYTYAYSSSISCSGKVKVLAQDKNHLRNNFERPRRKKLLQHAGGIGQSWFEEKSFFTQEFHPGRHRVLFSYHCMRQVLQLFGWDGGVALMTGRIEGLSSIIDNASLLTLSYS